MGATTVKQYRDVSPSVIEYAHSDPAAANEIQAAPVSGANGRAAGDMVNPLWMITAGLAVFFALMAVLIAAG